MGNLPYYLNKFKWQTHFLIYLNLIHLKFWKSHCSGKNEPLLFIDSSTKTILLWGLGFCEMCEPCKMNSLVGRSRVHGPMFEGRIVGISITTSHRTNARWFCSREGHGYTVFFLRGELLEYHLFHPRFEDEARVIQHLSISRVI